jgi:hypothetical protein
MECSRIEGHRCIAPVVVRSRLLRIRHPAEDLNRLGTKPREKLDEVKKEEKTLRDTYESNLATLKAKNEADLERHRG